MKCLVRFFLRFITHEKARIPFIDDIRWEQLDGAEFSVVYPTQQVAALDN